jgi:cytochrome c oxidase subunit 3
MSTDSHAAVVGGHQVAHHFKNAEHQYQTNKQGIWVFMVTEIMMFGGLFVGYAIFHALYPEMFAEGASHLDWRLGFLNTLVLIFSSLTMALGIYFSQRREKQKAVISLAITLLCGATFMCIKYMEYSQKFHHGLFPGKFFSAHEVEHTNLALYFSFYFCMTGLHGIHVLIGMGLITWVFIRTARGEFGPDYYTPLEGVGMIWQLVDLVWIYLFPILYLIG